MDSSDKPETLPPPPAYFHRPPFHHHHQCLELSPHCPQHGGYLLHPNSHHHSRNASAAAHSHYHLQLSPDCPLHGHLSPPCQLHTSCIHPINHRFPIIPNFSSIPLPQNPNFNFIPPEAESDANSKSEALNEEEEEEEEDDELIFVLTDEWKEFFAKSEAKRRLAKKQAKKKGKGKD